jgi:hypothetical protein
MALDKSDTEQDPASAGKGKRFDFKTLVKSGAIVPTLVIPVIAVAVISTIGFIVARSVNNGGFMPRPTALDTYNCKGFSVPFRMVFRHGMDVVQLQTGTLTLYGDLLNGKIAWEDLPNAIKQLGFVPPSEIVYDDTRLLRIVDASVGVRTERVCDRLE